MNKVYLYASAAVVLIAVSVGIWSHGYSHGVAVESGKAAQAIENARAEDAREIERLRGIVKKRRKVITRTVEVIRNVKDETPCQCFDVPAPADVIDSMLTTYDSLVRPAVDGTLSVCRVPLACDTPYYYSGPRGAVGAGGELQRQTENIKG